MAIVHLQRADREGNAHCWGNFGVMIEAVRAARRVIVVAEEIVDAEVIASDPNRTVIPGFLVNAVVECRYGAHPSPVQGYYKRDNAFFRQYHEQTKTKADSEAWLQRWVHGVADRTAYMNQLGRMPRGRIGRKAARVRGPDGFWVLRALLASGSWPNRAQSEWLRARSQELEARSDFVWTSKSAPDK